MVKVTEEKLVKSIVADMQSSTLHTKTLFTSSSQAQRLEYCFESMNFCNMFFYGSTPDPSPFMVNLPLNMTKICSWTVPHWKLNKLNKTSSESWNQKQRWIYFFFFRAKYFFTKIFFHFWFDYFIFSQYSFTVYNNCK